MVVLYLLQCYAIRSSCSHRSSRSIRSSRPFRGTQSQSSNADRRQTDQLFARVAVTDLGYCVLHLKLGSQLVNTPQLLSGRALYWQFCQKQYKAEMQAQTCDKQSHRNITLYKQDTASFESDNLNEKSTKKVLCTQIT